MTRFNVIALPLLGLKLVERQRLGDNRGFFSRLFCAEELAQAGWNKPIAQINHSYTAQRGTVRGLHFQQPPHAEMKLVACLHGRVWDLALDLRSDSPTFLRWYAEELSEQNQKTLLIPEGFAHAFQTLSDDVEMLYCHSVSYCPAAEGGLNPTDPLLSIDWPLEITELSQRDAQHPLIDKNFTGLQL